MSSVGNQIKKNIIKDIRIQLHKILSVTYYETLVIQWHKVNHALTARLLKFLYGPDYPVLQLGNGK
jgi:hypothetical protein